MEETSSFLQSSISQLHNSTLFTQNIEDLPYAIKQLDECLHKSNQNIFELKESLKFVLSRESRLQDEFNILQQRFEFTKHLYSNKELLLTKNYALKAKKFSDFAKRVPKLEQELENERKKIKEQEKELKDYHNKYIN